MAKKQKMMKEERERTQKHGIREEAAITYDPMLTIHFFQSFFFVVEKNLVFSAQRKISEIWWTQITNWMCSVL